MPEISTSAPSVVVPGNLDGVHRGHQALIEHASSIARSNQLCVVALTFEPHPAQFFAPDRAPAPLCTLERKSKLLKAYGVDTVHVANFDRAFSELSPESFIESVLIKQLNAQAIVPGKNFHFGKNRAGNTEVLVHLGKKYGLKGDAVSHVSLGEEVISSTRIRECLKSTRVAEASQLMARAYDIEGIVTQGKQIGRTLGFPTANLDEIQTLVPSQGVYLIAAYLPGDTQKTIRFGVCNIGSRPTLNTGKAIETHLFDENIDLYGRTLRIAFLEHLRDEQRFEHVDALKAQIAKDVEKAKVMLSSVSPHLWSLLSR
ncbi:MAG: bifunctional riboflavin kinase/FAD synthetase [Myxococcales bacterium]|nr:MAG: bifunctional riboflavin kinase/FAD synthetase [Myxococcales bacterium]